MQNNQDVLQPIALSFFKLGACLIYEALVVAAISLVCVSIFLLLEGDATHGNKRYLLQIFLLISVGAYFVWCWQKSGQTLAMQTWKLKLVSQDGHLLSLSMAISRYVFVCVSLILFGFGFLWVFVDRDRLFLHDRLLKNKIIYVPRNAVL
jgi:uncharacterized RDD family membrane protein YckC